MKLINPLPPDASYLYHYTSADTALNYILKNGTLKFNSFSQVNDPRESKACDFSPFVRDDLNLSREQYDSISREISDVLKANAKIVCFSQDKDAAIGKWQPEALLDRGFAKPSMWHHYGDKHCGLCLMFEWNKLNQAFLKQLDSGRLISGKVDYSNKGILPNLSKDPFVVNLIQVREIGDYYSAIKNHLNFWFQDLFLRKLSDWKNEDEYRWIYLDDNLGPIYVGFEGALEAIVIGEHVPNSYYEDILRYCVKYHADVTNLNWRNGYPKIEHPGQPHITHRHLRNGI
jgi:hypothetical protein